MALSTVLLTGLPKEPHTEINVVFSVIHSFLALTSETHHPFPDHMKVQTCGIHLKLVTIQ